MSQKNVKIKNKNDESFYYRFEKEENEKIYLSTEEKTISISKELFEQYGEFVDKFEYKLYDAMVSIDGDDDLPKWPCKTNPALRFQCGVTAYFDEKIAKEIIGNPNCKLIITTDADEDDHCYKEIREDGVVKFVTKEGEEVVKYKWSCDNDGIIYRFYISEKGYNFSGWCWEIEDGDKLWDKMEKELIEHLENLE